ncbi:MAG: sporulation integral membrane protein YlbJ [Clostridia bacterium]|nr:sporulation integral membrane protein YlbJ [Clostridia bacterium]
MFKFYVFKLKNYIFPFVFLLFTIFLICFSNSNISAAKTGLDLFANSVIPSLFPFFVATELLSHTSIIRLLGSSFNSFMKPLFNVRGEGSFALIMGIISGYPVGAKIACNFRKNNICSKEECERLLSFTNNSGPLFIVGTVGITMFKSSTIGILLLITHILASITVGIIFRFWKCSRKKYWNRSTNDNFAYSSNPNVNLSNLGSILGESITNSISTLLTIGGFVVIFSVIISILQNSHILSLFSFVFEAFHIPFDIGSSTLLGMIEITNGIASISAIALKKISINIIIIAFLLGFGGISVMLQVWSIVSKTDLSIKPYIYGKLLHGLFAATYAFIFMHIFPFFLFDL